MRNFLSFVWEVVKIVVIALVVVIPIRYFLFQPFIVKGQSMEPNFENNDYLIVDEISYRFRAPERGEVIVFKYPKDTTQRFIKRIIGLPGEEVQINNGKVTILKNGQPQVLDEKYLPNSVYTEGNIDVTLGANEYFVLGDNRNFSFDSRGFGVLNGNLIIGRAVLRAWPLATAAEISLPNY